MRLLEEAMAEKGSPAILCLFSIRNIRGKQKCASGRKTEFHGPESERERVFENSAETAGQEKARGFQPAVEDYNRPLFHEQN